MKLDFGRIITAMVTPFSHDNKIDWGQTEKLIHYLVDIQKTDSLVISGTTGESPTLTEDEKLELFEKVINYAQGRCKIIAGTGTNDTNHSIQFTRKAERLGVDGILLVTPYYNRPSQEGLYQHFKSIAETTSLPVMLYNVPKRTGVSITAETTIRLSKIPNIFATKEASSDLDEITKIIRDSEDGFLVYSGDDQLTLPILSIGGYGIVSVASHVIGKEISDMISLFLEGDMEEAAKLHGKLHPIFSGLFLCPNPVAVKYALEMKGMDVGGVRLPLIAATELEKQQISQLFKH